MHTLARRDPRNSIGFLNTFQQKSSLFCSPPPPDIGADRSVLSFSYLQVIAQKLTGQELSVRTPPSAHCQQCLSTTNLLDEEEKKVFVCASCGVS